MSRERSPRADQVLSRIRASADPAPGAHRRVLASVEQRIALEAGALGASAGRAASGVASGSNGGAALSRPARIPAPTRASHAVRVSGRLGRWGVFGLVAGAIGYQLGVSHERAANEAAALPVVAAAGPITEGTVQPLIDMPMPASPARDEPGQPAPEEVLPAVPADLSPSAASNAVAARSSSLAVPSRASRVTPARASTRAPGAEKPRASAANTAQPLSMAEILERLQRAQKALQDSDPHAALAELDALDALEQGGALADERRVLRALALCDIGLVGDARQVLLQLEGHAAESIYRGRLEQACAAALEP